MTTVEIGELIQATALFASLPRAQALKLAAHARLIPLLRGQVLFLAGEPAPGMYVIVSGSLQALRDSIEGREQIIHTEYAGATIAEVPMFDDGPYPSTVTAAEDSSVIFLERADVRAVCLANPQVSMAALHLLSRRLRKCAALVETLSLHDVDRRLAHFLLAQANGTTPPAAFTLELHLTHHQIAARIGSVREVVSRAFARLQRRGLIEIDHAVIHVPDSAAVDAYIRQKLARPPVKPT